MEALLNISSTASVHVLRDAKVSTKDYYFDNSGAWVDYTLPKRAIIDEDEETALLPGVWFTTAENNDHHNHILEIDSVYNAYANAHVMPDRLFLFTIKHDDAWTCYWQFKED